MLSSLLSHSHPSAVLQFPPPLPPKGLPPSPASATHIPSHPDSGSPQPSRQCPPILGYTPQPPGHPPLPPKGTPIPREEALHLPLLSLHYPPSILLQLYMWSLRIHGISKLHHSHPNILHQLPSNSINKSSLSSVDSVVKAASWEGGEN